MGVVEVTLAWQEMRGDKRLFGPLVQWIYINIRVCSAADAELWAVIYGLSLAWSLGLKKVILEVDSLLVVNWLKKVSDCDSNQANLIHICLDFLRRDQEVQIYHIFREMNQLVDHLANKALHMERGIQILTNARADFFQLMRNDIIGVAWERFVKVRYS